MAKRKTIGSRRVFPRARFPSRWFLANNAFTLMSAGDGFILVSQRTGKELPVKATTAQGAISELANRGFREG